MTAGYKHKGTAIIGASLNCYHASVIATQLIIGVFSQIQKYSNLYPTRCNVTQFIISGNCSTCFGWHLHPSSGTHATVSTASGTAEQFQLFHDSGR
jgi:hypothetical protein